MSAVQLTVISASGPTDGFSLIHPNSRAFSYRTAREYALRLPFLGRGARYVPQAVRAVFADDYDVLVYPNQISDLHVWLGLFFAKLKGQATCLWGHGLKHREGRITTACRKLLMRLADDCILYTDGGKSIATKKGLPCDRLHVAPNSLDTKTAREAQLLVARGTSQNALADALSDKEVVVYVGRLIESKKPLLLVDIISKVVAHRPLAHLLIIGDGPLKPELERRVRHQGLERHVTFTGAIHDEFELAPFLAKGALGIMPAVAGLAVQHCFHYGIPMIVGDAMNTHPPEIELVVDGVTGLLCKALDADEFANAIVRLLNDKSLREAMAARCKQLIEETYNVEQMTTGFLSAIQTAFARHRQNYA